MPTDTNGYILANIISISPLSHYGLGVPHFFIYPWMICRHLSHLRLLESNSSGRRQAVLLRAGTLAVSLALWSNFDQAIAELSHGAKERRQNDMDRHL
jgi:hypothetical protein